MPVGSRGPSISPEHHPSFLRNTSSPAPARTKTAGSVTAPDKNEPFHVIYKVPVGDSPYVKAKHLQLVEKDPNGAIALFWAAINAGDRVDSALKDMAIVMKQQDRPQEAIEAIKSFRHRCSDQAQESLDNVLIDLYKKCGRLDEQISLLRHKLCLIQQGVAFNGKPTKTARSHGKKFQVSIKQETTRLLGNLGWAYMQQRNYGAAEVVYRKAEVMDPDSNKACNLSVCLMKQGKGEEAAGILEGVISTYNRDVKSLERAEELLKEVKRERNAKRGASTSPACEARAKRDFEESGKEWRSAEDLLSPLLEEVGGFGRRREGREGTVLEGSGGETTKELSHKRNRLRVFQEMTSLKDEVAY